MQENTDSLTADEKKVIQELGQCNDKSNRGVRTIALEDKLSLQIEVPRKVLGDLWKKAYVSLHRNDGTEHPGQEGFFEDDSEEYTDTYVYSTLGYKLTQKGRELYDQLPKTAETNQDIAPAKRARIGAWLWKLYEKTLKAVAAAILERVWPK